MGGGETIIVSLPKSGGKKAALGKKPVKRTVHRDLRPTPSLAPQGRSEALARKYRSRNQLRQLFRYADRIDWRYKVLLTVGFALAMVGSMYLFRERILAMGNWGYLGAFIINGLSSATIIIPAPGGIIISIMAEDFNPILIGIAAGLGGTLGGLTAYLAGALNASRARRSRWFPWLQRLMRRLGNIIIFTFALIPILPGDFATIAAGTVRYPLRKYLLYNGIASVIKMSVMAYLGADFLLRLEHIVTGWVKTLF